MLHRAGVRNGEWAVIELAAMLAQDLLDILVCPVCKKPLAYNEQAQTLKCAECRRVYPVRDDIPILLKDEASIDEQ